MISLRLKRLKPALELLSTVILIVSCAVFLWRAFWRTDTQAATPGLGVRVNFATDVQAEISAERVRFQQGNARVALIEFSDLDCPFCRKFAEVTYPAVKRELIDAGVIRYVVFDSPIEALHPTAFLASQAAQCAGEQSRFWEMRERLFANPSQRSNSDFDSQSAALGLDSVRFRHCMAQQHAADAIRDSLREAERLGVMGTPTFFLATVNQDGSLSVTRKLAGAISFDALKTEVETFVKKTL